jgi:hypothetical protein
MLLEKSMLHGIEVVNGREYYPEAHRWALEKKLAMLSNSDVHAPLNMDYLPREGDHRPITLVFAKERTAAALKEALFARRTAVYSGEKLIGDEAFLKPIFQRSIRLNKQSVAIKGKQRVAVQISNDSDLSYELERAAALAYVTIPKKLVLPARKTVILALEGKSATTDGVKEIELPFKVRNLWIGPEQPLAITLPLSVRFSPSK